MSKDFSFFTKFPVLRLNSELEGEMLRVSEGLREAEKKTVGKVVVF